MRKLILSPEWKSSPIKIDYTDGYDDWFDNYGSYIDPEELPGPLTKELCNEIWTWAEKYDKFLNWNDPRESIVIPIKEEADFWQEGFIVKIKLQKELGENFYISYNPPINFK